MADAIPDKDWQARITKQVDFNNEMLLFFTWTGSGDDRLSVAGKETSVDSLLLTEMLEEIRLLDIYGPDHPTVRAVQARIAALKEMRAKSDMAGSVAVFRYAPSGADSKGVFRRLFVLPKNQDWKVEQVKEHAADVPPAVREIDLTGLDVDIPVGSVYKPLEIRDAEGLTKIAAKAATLEKLAKLVSLDAERLAWFSWKGQPGDGLTCNSYQARGRTYVVFTYELSHDKGKPVVHRRLFAVANDANWRVEEYGKRSPPEPAGPAKDDATTKLLNDLDSKDALVRGAAIDLLGEQKAKEAIPRLVELAEDFAGLDGSDNYVSLHAVRALQQITGESFVEPNEWRSWAKQKKVGTSGEGGVRVIRAEATVELRGILAFTPKGVFVLVKESHPVGAEDQTETATWELDLSKVPDLEKLAKELSGKDVTVFGICPLEAVPWREPKQSALMPWEMKKVVAVSKLSAAEKK